MVITKLGKFTVLEIGHNLFYYNNGSIIAYKDAAGNGYGLAEYETYFKALGIQNKISKTAMDRKTTNYIQAHSGVMV
jgi:hypothetical protein